MHTIFHKLSLRVRRKCTRANLLLLSVIILSALVVADRYYREIYLSIAYRIKDMKMERIGNRILENRKRLQTHQNYVTNYTILTDPYFTVQLADLPQNPSIQPICERTVLKYVDFKLCPHIRDELLINEFRKGHWFDIEVATMIRMVQEIPNAGFIDVGASIGYFTVPMLVAMDHKVKVIAIDPMPGNIRSIKAAVDANNIPYNSISVIQRAIADTVDKNVTFYMAQGFHSGGLHQTSGSDAVSFPDKASYNVTTATFDSHILPVAKAMNISTAVIKIDIEGAECLAIKGAKKFLAEIYVPYIMTYIFYATHHAGVCGRNARNTGGLKLLSVLFL